jgi:hypothetical protein
MHTANFLKESPQKKTNECVTTQVYEIELDQNPANSEAAPCTTRALPQVDLFWNLSASIDPNRIVVATCNKAGVTPRQVIEYGKDDQSINNVRMMLSYLLRTYCDLSFVQLSQAMLRDTATVQYHVKKIKAALENSPLARRMVEDILKEATDERD